MHHDTRRIIEAHVRQYIRAKDENRPHLMPSVFAPHATLEMIVKTDNIYFPAVSRGLPAVSEVLVSHFAQKYENVYTFCLGRPRPGTHAAHYLCDWMVGMSEKSSGMARLGHGRYDWYLSPELQRVERLVITIDSMQVLSSETLAPMLDWLSALPYPFCPLASLKQGMPQIESVQEMVHHLVAMGTADEQRNMACAGTA